MIRARNAVKRTTFTLFRQARSLHLSAASQMPCDHYTAAEKAELAAQERRELERRFIKVEANWCDAMSILGKIEAGEALSEKQQARLDALKEAHQAHRLAEHAALITDLREQKLTLETKIKHLTEKADSKADDILQLQTKLKEVLAELDQAKAVDTDSHAFLTKEDDCSKEAVVVAGSGCRV